MKLIRRKKKPTPAQQALEYVKLGVRGLVAVRVARNAFKTYKFARKLPLIAAGLAIAALVARKARSGGGGDATEAQWTPPSTAQEPSSPSVPSTPAASTTPTSGSTNGATTPPPAVETAATGSSPADVEPEAPTAPAAEVAIEEAPAETAASTDTTTSGTEAAEDGPGLKPEGGDVAPELGSDEK